MYRGFDLVDGQLAERTGGETAAIRVYINPSADERNYLVTTLGVDEYDLNSALDPEEVSRIEVDSDRLLIVWKRPSAFSLAQNRVFEGSSVGILLEKTRVTLVMADESLPFSERKYKPGRTINEFVIHFLLYTIHHYLNHLRAIKAISKELQVKLNTSMENAYFLQMFALSESLIYYVNAIEANGGVLVRLRGHAERLALTPEEIELLDDTVIENRQCLRQSEIHADVLSGLMDARGNIINNNMNVLLKNLTIINIVFLPLNLIASMGGMSEYSALTDAIGMPHWLSWTCFSLLMIILGWATWKFLINRIDRSPRSGGTPPVVS
jgi:magnesium transporter